VAEPEVWKTERKCRTSEEKAQPKRHSKQVAHIKNSLIIHLKYILIIMIQIFLNKYKFTQLNFMKTFQKNFYVNNQYTDCKINSCFFFKLWTILKCYMSVIEFKFKHITCPVLLTPLLLLSFTYYFNAIFFLIIIIWKICILILFNSLFLLNLIFFVLLHHCKSNVLIFKLKRMKTLTLFNHFFL
jgi:hypothetical protein